MKINEQKLEETLVSNWTSFIEPIELRNFVFHEVQKNLNSLTIIPNKKNKINANSISISRFYLSEKNYFIWVDFLVVIEKKLAEGTMEVMLPMHANAKLHSIMGNLYHI